MTTKNTLKTVVENFIEQSIVSSSYIKKIIANITIMALESKKITETILLLNKRLDDHETIILKLLESNKASQKDSLVEILNSKEKNSKPN